MGYSREYSEGKTFLGCLINNKLFAEFTRLCKLAGRSKAKELESSVTIRVKQLQQQERQGTIRGLR